MIIILITVTLLLAFFSTQIALFLNFVIGNDTAVKLKVSPEYLQLVHGQKEPLVVEASVTTNPFCKAECSSTFEDISSHKIIDNATFTLRPSDPFQHQYEIIAPATGEGIKVYRFSMECKSVQTVLCHTSEEPSTRSVLITAEYSLTEEEKELRSTLQQQLQAISHKISALEVKSKAYETLLSQLNFSWKPLAEFSIELQDTLALLRETESIWLEQDFNALVTSVSELNTLLARQEQQHEMIAGNMTAIVGRHNLMIQKVNEIRMRLELSLAYDAINSTDRERLNATVGEFDTLLSLLSQPISFEQKESAANLFSDKVKVLTSTLHAEQRKEVLKKGLEADLNSGLLCDTIGVCQQHPSLSARANQTEFSLNQTCEDSNLLRTRIIEINSSFQEEYITENYPEEDAFRGNISAHLFNLKQQKINEYQENIPENKTNTLLLRELLVEQPLLVAEEYPSYNLTSGLLAELARQLPAPCAALPPIIPELLPLNFTSVEIPAALPVAVDMAFAAPEPQCCIFGQCQACCLDEECRNDPSTYPVVFIHGHAVSKDTSFEYSLEGFNQIQKKMEKDGYLSAGSITLYTSRNIPEGIWGKLPVPVSIRASYYFDLFQQPENYVVVQAKSENIDTYAVRLKEVIDTIKYKTGKPKVNIVAFSMGGLVSRRYIQIFGKDEVNKLILIGVPNKGIVGNVADYCSVTGEQRECLDMDAQSLFMNKLNRGSLPGIPIYNIIGTGCDMDGKQGDGAVLEENAYLEGAQNFIVKGKCESVSEPLHLQLRDVRMYPKVYEKIKEALQG